MSNNKDITVHPSLSPRLFILIPYYFHRVNKITKKVDEETGNITRINPVRVESFHSIKSEVVKALNLPFSAKVRIDSIGEEGYDEGFCFGNSIVVEIETDEYSFGISFDCYSTINAYQWGENAHWGEY